MEARKSVVLLSGGLDSAVLLHKMHEDSRILPLFIDYGQRAARLERVAAEAQCRTLGLDLAALDVSAVGRRLHAASRTSPHNPLPLRNLVLVSLSLSYAEWARASRVATAIIRDDLGSYSCTSGSFWYTFRDLAATIGDIGVETPFIYFDKAAVIEEGLRRGVDLTLTYSCSVGRERHCGGCRQCLLRRTAALRAGLVEPANFYVSDARSPGPRTALTRVLEPAKDGAWLATGATNDNARVGEHAIED